MLSGKSEERSTFSESNTPSRNIARPTRKTKTWRTSRRPLRSKAWMPPSSNRDSTAEAGPDLSQPSKTARREKCSMKMLKMPSARGPA